MASSAGDRQHRNEVVRIAELTVNTSELVKETFSNCRIIGPAVLVPMGNTSMLHCGFDTSDVNALFWELPLDRNYVVGAVGVRDCTFSSCNFTQIGLAGPSELRGMIAAALGGDTD